MVEVWVQDEMRVGQFGRTGRVWFTRGMRSRGLKDMRHEPPWVWRAV